MDARICIFTVPNITVVAPTIRLPTSYKMFHTYKPFLTLLIRPLCIPNIELLTEPDRLSSLYIYINIHNMTQTLRLKLHRLNQFEEVFHNFFGCELQPSPALNQRGSKDQLVSRK